MEYRYAGDVYKLQGHAPVKSDEWASNRICTIPPRQNSNFPAGR